MWGLLWWLQHLISGKPGVGTLSQVNVGVIVVAAAFNQWKTMCGDYVTC